MIQTNIVEKLRLRVCGFKTFPNFPKGKNKEEQI